VLVVEDDRTARRAISSILKMQGYVVYEAATLADARRLAQPPNEHEWILLDLMLPDGNGTDLLRDVRQGAVPASKVCVVTGCGSAMLCDVEALAPEQIFAKPLDVDRLLDALLAPSVDTARNAAVVV
jgi:DNA-binding response OmpR family regulator